MNDPPKPKKPISAPFSTAPPSGKVNVMLPTFVAPITTIVTTPHCPASTDTQHRLFSQSHATLRRNATGLTE